MDLFPCSGPFWRRHLTWARCFRLSFEEIVGIVSIGLFAALFNQCETFISANTPILPIITHTGEFHDSTFTSPACGLSFELRQDSILEGVF